MSGAALLLALAFAFPNEEGTQLLVTAEVVEPEHLRVALCSGSQQLQVQFERRQSERSGGTGRQIPRNFAYTAGSVFRVGPGKVSAQATCLLTDESFLRGATLFPVKRPSQPARCPKTVYPNFQADKGRPVVGCWPIAESPTGVRIAIIEFARQLTNALASLALIDGDRRMYVDFPAQFTGPGDDLWRADDGGEIHAEGFDVLFILKRGSTYTIAIDWGGAEGRALSVHVSDGISEFKEVVTDSWYTAPI
jgi:hypothetical protein